MGLEFSLISSLIEEINETEECELERECALRGIKYKKRAKLQKMEESKELDDAVQKMINKRSSDGKK